MVYQVNPSIKKYRRHLHMNSRKTTLYITRSALVAALYAALTLLLKPISYGPMQFRLSELLTLLPVLMPSAIPGLAIGCLVANILSAYGVFDMVLGTLATLTAAILTRLLRAKLILAALPPVLLNALIVPLIFVLNGDSAAAYLTNFLSILLTQAVIVYAIGIPVTLGLRRTGLFE